MPSAPAAHDCRWAHDHAALRDISIPYGAHTAAQCLRYLSFKYAGHNGVFCPDTPSLGYESHYQLLANTFGVAVLHPAIVAQS
jgi:hypothetical protein